MLKSATSLFRSDTRTVRYIPISKIDQKAIASVRKTLNSLNKRNCAALLIGINSRGGSVVEAEMLGEMLQTKTKKSKIPLVMYAEESCTNSAMTLLTYGDHMIAH